MQALLANVLHLMASLDVKKAFEVARRLLHEEK